MRRKTKELSRWQRALVPSITDLLFISMFLLLVAVGSSVLLSDADIGWHIRAGDYILKAGVVPKEDIFSYTLRDRAWYAWEWLFEVILAVLHRRAGLNGVVVFAALIITLTYTLLFRLLLQRSMDLVLSLALMLTAFLASSAHWLARPHLISWLFTLLWFWACDEYQNSGKKYLLLLPLLMILWVNLHGGFLLGILLLLVYSLANALTYLTAADPNLQQQAARRALYFIALLAVCSLATLANPYGYKLHGHIAEFLRRPIIYQISGEFKSPNFHQFPIKFFEGLLLLSLPVSVLALRTLRFVPLLLVIASIHLSLVAVRNIPLAGLMVAAVMAVPLREGLHTLMGHPALRLWLRATIQNAARFSSELAVTERALVGHWLPAALVLLAIVICANGGRLPGKGRWNSEFAAYKYPMAVSEFIRRQPPPGRVFNTYEWGGLLIYNLYPEFKVFVDSRCDVYPEDFLQRYLAVVEVKPDWQKILQEAQIDWVIVPAWSALASALRATREWKILYDDDVALVCSK